MTQTYHYTTLHYTTLHYTTPPLTLHVSLLQAFFITNDEPIPFWDMVTYVWRELGYPTPKYKIPYYVAWFMAILFEFLMWIVSPFYRWNPTYTWVRFRYTLHTLTQLHPTLSLNSHLTTTHNIQLCGTPQLFQDREGEEAFRIQADRSVERRDEADTHVLPTHAKQKTRITVKGGQTVLYIKGPNSREAPFCCMREECVFLSLQDHPIVNKRSKE